MKNHFEFILKATGVVTSPNHPDNYPHNLDKTEIIEVESGKILRLEFTHFEVWACDISTCSCDYVKITDGDGTILMDKSCGYSSEDPSSSEYFLPPMITTMTNKAEIFFHTDDNANQPGWSLSWTAITPGFNALNIYRNIYSFYQSAALLPLAAPAQTWRLTTANMNLWMLTQLIT